ncbi:MAG: RHS repeat-associated core domain-containing protein, partial [Myxococcales bacterium]|nr:RHS repeat-associated core domain-containing protein [Myxococcales bacterium]
MLRTTDVRIQSYPRSFELRRTYDSHTHTWEVDDVVKGVPKPFGSSPSNSDSLQWWHDYYSLIKAQPFLWSVRDTDGRLFSFEPCSGSPCWAARHASNMSVPERLQSTDAGFVLVRADGHRLAFEAPWATAPNSVDRHFLSRIENGQGVTLATVSYALPVGLSCPRGDAGTQVGVPYISEVRTTDGTRLVFNYTDFGGAGECAVSSIDRSPTSSDGGEPLAPAVSFQYVMDGGAPRPGLLRSATTADGTTTYDYPVGELRITEVDGEVVRHLYSSGAAATSLSSASDNYSIDYDAGTTPCQTGSECCGYTPAIRLVADLAAGRGDGLDGGAGLTTRYETLSALGQESAQRVYRTDAGCSVANACSPGSIQYEWACSTSTPGYEKAVKDKRDNWEAYAWSVVGADAGAPENTLERRAIKRGASNMDASDGGLEEEYFDYLYGANQQQLLKDERAESVLAAGEDAGTRYTYDSTTNRRKAQIRYGKTKLLDGGMVTRHVGTFFYDCEQPNGGSCAGQEDTYGRVRAVHGPCFVAGPTSVDCDLADGGFPPATRYSYYLANSGNTSNRLQKVSRFPQGLSGASLDTTFDTYDDRGNPLQVTDENGIVTNYTYVEDRVTLRRVQLPGGGTAETAFGYEAGRLIWVRWPEGNYEVFCYRVGAANGCTGGTLSPRLQWRAKASDQNGQFWAEKVEYPEYWPDGTLRTEAYYSSVDPNIPRRVMTFAADAHRRPTWSEVGNQQGKYSEVRAFDRADNLVGTGFGYNSPPAWCNGVTADIPASPLCHHLLYDKANRLDALTEFPTSTSGGIKTRLAYDKQGNICAVTVDATGSWAQSCTNTGGSDDPKTAYYQHDDFGNVIETRLPNTDNGAGAKGTARFEYDALGNVVAKQTEQQRQAVESLGYTFDALGRLTGAYRTAGGPAEWLYTLDYDTSAGLPHPSCPQPANTKGRLLRMTDSSGTTWYQYDAEGRVLKEIRLRPGATTCGGTIDDNPHATYTYTPNGNLSTITYPHGRTIRYWYSGGAETDRIFGISVDVWSQGSWLTEDLFQQITWEPYGGVRDYQVYYDHGNFVHGVEYLLGDNASAAPASYCPTSPPSMATSDHTGRLRAIWVSEGGVGGGGEIYKRTYTWKADQVARTDTCFLGATQSQVEDYGSAGDPALVGYDQMLRLKSADAPRFSSTGGPFKRRVYNYDSRSNRTWMGIEPIAPDLGIQYTYGGGPLPDRLTGFAKAYDTSTKLSYTLAYDRDGRASSKRWTTDSSGTYNYFLDFAYGPEATQSTIETVFKAANVNGGWYNYFYDAFGRRRKKVDPVNADVEFFYDLGKQPLEDRGALVGGTYRPIDEYVWLDGRPVAFIRGKFDQNWNRLDDLSGDCARPGETSVNCSIYTLISDHIGKPVLAIDYNALIAGTGEHDPFGHPNRVQQWGESAHPYPATPSETWLADFIQPTLGMRMDVRVRLSFMDTENCGSTYFDPTNVKNGDTLAVLAGPYGGYHKGDTWTSWVGAPTSGHIVVTFNSTSGNFAPGNSACLRRPPSWNYEGVALQEYEYRRFQNGATPLWTPLRFPGQYHDAETDLFENWNRYYDPAIGRYLQPEPLQQDPEYLRFAAAMGHSVPVYAYALDNPLFFTDETGNAID